MPIVHLLLIDASGAIVGQPTPRQWLDGVRLPDGRRSIDIDGATFTMASQRMSVMQLRSKLGLESSLDEPPPPCDSRSVHRRQTRE